MTDLQTALLALAIFAVLVLAYGVIAAMRASWDRNGRKGTEFRPARIELVGFRFRG